mgnify:CR=1 FL=1
MSGYAQKKNIERIQAIPDAFPGVSQSLCKPPN